MRAEERAALEAAMANLVPAPTPDDVWRPPRFDVRELHERVVREVLTGVNKARRHDDSNPLGVAVQGRAGSGKTHLLGAVRDTIQREGGYFFLVNLVNGRTFWQSVAVCMVEGLSQDAIGWGTQHKTFLRRLTAQLGIPAEVRDAVAGDAPITRVQLDTFIRALRTFDRDVGKQCQDTARALVLNGAADFEAQDVGYAHLISDPGDPAMREEWGLSQQLREPEEIVRDISRLIALTLDPSVIAFDQLDTLFAQSTTVFFREDNGQEMAAAMALAPVADGLLRLRDITRRTLVVVSCLPDTWVALTKSAPAPVLDRFREANLPDRIPRAAIAEAIIAKRFKAAFDDEHFSAPYPTWPIKPEAFADAEAALTPRALLRRVDAHLRRCLDRDVVTEATHLLDDIPVQREPKQPSGADKRSLDQHFAELVAAADVRDALDPATEDQHMPALLSAGLTAWIDEQAPTGRTYKIEPQRGKKPALHGRLIEVLDEATENEADRSFRAIASANATAVISRIKAACTKAGLDPQVPLRRLVVLRRGPWPSGPRTKEVTDAFVAAGGIVHQITEEDLKVFAALRDMQSRPDPHLEEWLAARRPASGTSLLRSVLGGSAPDATADEVVLKHDRPSATTHPAVEVGRTADSGSPLAINLESLRRHTVIFAGSGSGKTVLIRRLVEECARRGVSAIVLDPNNDLARLGDAWPEPPNGWLPGDDIRAKDYLEHTEVVIWTPRISAGRPIAFQPLPDFRPVRDSADEFDQAVRSAVEALAPRAGVNGATKLAQQGKAVLTEALRAYATGGGVGLRGFTEFLSELPDGVSRMARATKLAHDLAETLKAAMITDPLFGGEGTPADPSMLLMPGRGKRARVSVISFVGLTSNEERQSFVNQLQMALFAWIKRNPAGDRPLGGIFVMDEAQTLAPSTGHTACTASTIALASQARKYGLGLVFATQAPKGLHNQISGNATTQFFGLLNSPAQIDAARELAHAKGGRLPDIGLLGSGQFYVAGEGFSFVKIKAPMCLTYHPKAPLSPEEVVLRSRDAL
jgi:hypothetical protein